MSSCFGTHAFLFDIHPAHIIKQQIKPYEGIWRGGNKKILLILRSVYCLHEKGGILATFVILEFSHFGWYLFLKFLLIIPPPHILNSFCPLACAIR